VLLIVQAGRQAKYGQQTAEEWPIGHTPPEIVEERAAKVMDLEALMGADTPTSSGDDDDYNAQASPLKYQVASAASRRPHRLLTPSSPLCTLETPHSCPTNAVEDFILPDSVPPVAAYDTAANCALIETKERERDVEAEKEEAEEQPGKARNTRTTSTQQRSSNTLHEVAPWRIECQRDGAKTTKEKESKEQPITVGIVDIESAPQRPSEGMHNTPRGTKRQRDTRVDEEKEGTVERPTKIRAPAAKARRPRRRPRCAAT
jgi:hypothetical protein